ncbi:flagellar basal body-associated FliL family protein [Aquabacterium sp. A7-Y]|uniref:flagellar basal body-associated FliL family protein n=1 Tax=Aquabacterium sp. A7-Y TaxID=1349605 RepID=UPI00223DD852|nr:flagellar basal body-associated FliL family protein [Aquabacterium sp. A7-Y]MCW7536527.1 flagellar basal body-associated FliL family protein [Aquabacterium sp. A7-Y]
MKKSMLVLSLVLGGTLIAAAAGGAAWFLLPRQAAAGAPAAAAPPKPELEPDTQEYRYVTLDKVIVMLRGLDGEARARYIAVDLVFKTPVKKEKATKAQLPLLRSVTVQALSNYTREQASQMNVEQFTAVLNRAFAKRYASDRQEAPFTQAMLGKLIIE